MDKKPKAYSYIRMSTDIQLKGDSLRRQKELSQKYADLKGLELVETIEDIGISAFSGKNSREGALGDFLAAIHTGKIKEGSYLLIESLDRLSRDTVITAFTQFTTILQHKITIVTLTDNQEYTDTSIGNNAGQLFTSIGIMLRANDESKTKSNRLKASWENKRNNLNVKKYTSKCPAWLDYDKENEKFIEIEYLVKSVKKIFNLSIEGYGAYSITNHLNSNINDYPAKKKGNGWGKSYIQKILNNKSVYGEFQPHTMEDGKRIPVGDPIQNYFPILISKSDFEKSQLRLSQRLINGSGRKGSLFPNLFTRIIFCGCCSASVVFRNKGEPPKGGKYLKCSNSERKFRCKAPSWEYSSFEESFFTFIRELNIDEIFDNKEVSKKLSAINDEIELLQLDLLNTENEFSNLMNRLSKVDDDMIVDVKRYMREKKDRIEKIKNEIRSKNTEQIKYSENFKKSEIINNVLMYEQLIAEKSDSEIREIRQKLQTEIKKIVKSIKLNNFDNFNAGDDIYAFIDDDFNNELKNKNLFTTEQQENYLITEYGNRFFNKYNRTYTVIFKNGITRVVQPSRKLKYNFDNSKLKKFII